FPACRYWASTALRKPECPHPPPRPDPTFRQGCGGGRASCSRRLSAVCSNLESTNRPQNYSEHERQWEGSMPQGKNRVSRHKFAFRNSLDSSGTLSDDPLFTGTSINGMRENEQHRGNSVDSFILLRDQSISCPLSVHDRGQQVLRRFGR